MCQRNSCYYIYKYHTFTMKVTTFKFGYSLKQVIEERGTEDMKKVMKSLDEKSSF